MTLTLKNKVGIVKELSLVTDNFSHTRPSAIILNNGRVLVVNVKGIRQIDIGKNDLLVRIQKLCVGMGRVDKIVSCTRDLYENKPVPSDGGKLKEWSLTKWSLGEDVWYTFK